MIGNDVVDLAQSRVESRWQRKGFTEKLFSASEQKLISGHNEPEIMIWLLWSMKEAAYKIYNRQTKIREYSPKKITCKIHFLNTNNVQGEVLYYNQIYYTKSTITLESIHTVAVSFLKDIDNVVEIQNNGIIKDENGIPYLHLSESNLKEVSISHHGRYKHIVTIY